MCHVYSTSASCLFQAHFLSLFEAYLFQFPALKIYVCHFTLSSESWKFLTVSLSTQSSNWKKVSNQFAWYTITQSGHCQRGGRPLALLVKLMCFFQQPGQRTLLILPLGLFVLISSLLVLILCLSII